MSTRKLWSNVEELYDSAQFLDNCAFFLGGFFKYPIKKELKTYPGLMTNGLPEKITSLLFFTCMSLMPWWKVSNISRDKGVYTLSYSSFNTKSKSLCLLPESLPVQVVCSHTGFLRSSQNIPLFETGRSHQPTFSSKHQVFNFLTWYWSFCVPRALYVLVPSIS